MKRVRFDGRGRLRVFGYDLASNQVVEMTDEEAAELAANPRIRVTVLGVTTHRAETHESEGATNGSPA